MRLQLATLTRDSLHSTVSPGGVTDFIDIGVASWRFWTFNVADAGITIGAVLLAFVL
jgi:lipoprotein signal peptidase